MSKREFRIEMRSNPSPDPRDGEGLADAVRRAMAVRVIYERQDG